MGVTIVKTNHLPNFDAGVSGYEIGEPRYNLNFSSTDRGSGIVVATSSRHLQPKAVAELSLTGLKVDTVDDIHQLGLHRCVDDGWHGRPSPRVRSSSVAPTASKSALRTASNVFRVRPGPRLISSS